jgi:DNA primase
LALKHSTPFNPKALESSEIFLTESVIDALTLYSYGIENVVGTYGTNSFKEDYLRLMTESNTRKVVISYDNDMAGNSAATYLTGILNENGIEAFRLGLPSGLDVNGYFCQTDYPRVKIDKL